MSLSYDVFTEAFIAKVTEYDFIRLSEDDRQIIIDGYLKRALTAFKKNCLYDLFTTADDDKREFNVDISGDDLDEIVEIVSEGMLIQWMKPLVYRQENLEDLLNTKDFTVYSPAELLLRIGNAYTKVQKDYLQLIREYSYNHGALTELHI